MRKGKIYFLAIFLFFLPYLNYGQSHNFRKYSIEDGLVQSQIRSIYQDNEGYLWFGTYAGISVYNGIDFENFTFKDGLKYSSITKIIQDSSNRFWIFSRNNLFSFLNGKFAYEKLIPDIDKDDIYSTIFKDNRGNLWVGTTNQGLLKINGNGIEHITPNMLRLNSEVTSIIQDKKGRLIVGTKREGVFRFDGEFTDKFKVGESKRSNHIRYLCRNKDKVWICTNDGMYYLKGDSIHSIAPDHLAERRIKSAVLDKGRVWMIIENEGVGLYDGNTLHVFTEKNSPVNTALQNILLDGKNNLWITTGNGLIKYDNYLSREAGEDVFTLFTIDQGLSNNTTGKLFEDNEGNIWIGADGQGVMKYSNSVFQVYNTKHGMSHDCVIGINQDRDGNMWFATLGGGINYYKNNEFLKFTKTTGIKTNISWDIFNDSHGDFWYTEENVATYRLINSDFSKSVEYSDLRDTYSIKEDENGRIWIATNEGLYSYNREKFTLYNTENGLLANQIWNITFTKSGEIFGVTQKGLFSMNVSKTGLSGNIKNFPFKDVEISRSHDIVEDHKGNIWFDTKSLGVVRFDGESFQVISENEGLSSNTIYFSIMGKDDYLWLGGVQGIDRLNTKRYNLDGKIEIKHYGSEEGVVGLEGNGSAAIRDDKGNLWFGTIGGAIKYNPKEDVPNFREPTTNIRNIKLFHRDTSLSNNAVLPHYRNHFTFEYIGISYANPTKVKYQYKLEGFDKDWSPITNERKATYSNLPGGEYSFKVKACNFDGVWNQHPTTFSFTITPPFWRTWLFYISAILVLTLLVYLLIIWRIQRLKRHQIYLAKIIREKTKDLIIANKELDKLSLVARKTDNYVIITNGKDEIEWVNDAFASITGYTLNDVEGKKPRDVLRGEGSSLEDIKEIEDAIKLKKPFSGEILNYTKNGDPVWLFLNVTPILNQENKVVQFISVGSDISKLKESKDRVIKQKEEIEVKNKKLWQTSMKVMQEKEKIEKLVAELKGKNFELETLFLVANNTDNLVVIVDLEAKVEWFNQSFLKLKGYSQEKLDKIIGDSFKNYSSNPKILNLIKDCIKTKKSFSYESINKDANDKERAMASTATPILDENGEVRNIVIIDADISELKKAEEQIKKHKEQIETQNIVLKEVNSIISEQKAKAVVMSSELAKSNKALELYASAASHDLKEPLRKITFQTERLQHVLKNKIEENDYLRLAGIHKSATRLRTLIIDILNYSRLTRSKVEFKNINLNDVVNEVIDELEQQVKESKGIVECVDLPNIDASKSQMSQLFQNLISNALKFHRPDSPPIVKIKKGKLSNGLLVIEVKDNGVGFEQKHAENIFKPFHRLHSRNEFEGTGMGTAICHKIVESHSGEISVKSKLGEGTTFYIKLPLKQSAIV